MTSAYFNGKMGLMFMYISSSIVAWKVLMDLYYNVPSTEWDRGSKEWPSACFLIISYSNRHLCPLQILSNTLEICLSIMELQWPEFLITSTF